MAALVLKGGEGMCEWAAPCKMQGGCVPTPGSTCSLLKRDCTLYTERAPFLLTQLCAPYLTYTYTRVACNSKMYENFC